MTYTIEGGGTMDTEEFNSEKKKPVQKNLEEMSIESLGEYITELEAEIYRVREVIALKNIAQKNAKGFFK